MHIREFIDRYRPNADESMETVKSIFNEHRVIYSAYECPDAAVFVVVSNGTRKAYLMFKRFSKRVFTLMQSVCEMETGTLIAETEDSRIAKWLGRLGFDRVFDIEGTPAMKFVRTNHV